MRKRDHGRPEEPLRPPDPAAWRWRVCRCGVTFLGAQDLCLACRTGARVVRVRVGEEEWAKGRG